MLHSLTETPVQELHDPLFAEKQVRVFIKRDDMIHPFLSGNKWRKLKYILQKASAENKTHLVTFGGAWSNHLPAVACGAAGLGLKSTGFVRGEEVNNLVISLCRLFGMQLIFTSREAYREKEDLFQNRFGTDPSAFFIDEGGAGPDAARGCAELLDELEHSFDHIFCAAGTGTTAAGILNGIGSKKLKTLLHVVPVLKSGEFLKQDIEKLLISPANFRLHTDYHFGGYGKTNPELIRFICSFTSDTGILADPIYTGKCFFACFDLLARNEFKPGETILLVHTGGLTGIAGKLDEFSVPAI